MDTEIETETEEIEETEETETTEISQWKKVLDLVLAAFQEGRLAEEATWQEVVLISKGVGH